MKLIKCVLASVCALAILAGGINLQAQCGKCDKKSKCCEEAKKAGKTCDKCKKPEPKKQAAE